MLPRLAAGEAVGTVLVATTPPLAARKQWLADHLQLMGQLVPDPGAVDALRAGRSLLPIGVAEVRGEFERGAAVACIDANGHEVARGLINYAASDARRIARRPSGEIDVVVWERGSGITLACGTGACATVVAACLEERLVPGIERLVHLPGGSLSILVDKGYTSVRMRGPARIVFEASLDTRDLPRFGELQS